MFTTTDTLPVVECMEELVKIMQRQSRIIGRLDEAELIQHIERHPTLPAEFREDMKLFIQGVILDSRDEVEELRKNGVINSVEDAWKLPFLLNGV